MNKPLKQYDNQCVFELSRLLAGELDDYFDDMIWRNIWRDTGYELRNFVWDRLGLQIKKQLLETFE
jgi:hypothetical protein